MKGQIIMAAGVAFLAAGCGSGISTSTDYDPSASFAGYSTYDWVDSEGQVDDITSSRIRQSVDAGMAARGFRKDTRNPDLAISYQVPTRERTSFNTINTGWGGGYGWGGWGMGMGSSTTTQDNWTEGSRLSGMALFEVSLLSEVIVRRIYRVAGAAARLWGDANRIEVILGNDKHPRVLHP